MSREKLWAKLQGKIIAVGLTSWLTLADVKESFPIQVAEYAKAVGIDNEPAFAWWVPHVLKKRDRIVSKLSVARTNVKFGIDIPLTVKQAYAMDKENGNTLWTDAINKEMLNVRIAFQILKEGESVPIGSTYGECHMIFDVKFGEGFRRKARMVFGGHKVPTPEHLRYTSVVSRETVRIALTMAALNDLEVKASLSVPV